MSTTLQETSSQPPSYDECDSSLQEPVLLVLAGQSIRGGSAAGPALYETNRGVANLGHATTCVELTRVERSVRSSITREEEEEEAVVEDDGREKEQQRQPGGSEALVTPRVKVRRRHIVDLVHPTGKGGTATSLAEAAAGTPTYYAKPWTKKTHQGAYGLKKAHVRARWQVLPVREKARYGEPAYEGGGGGPGPLMTVKEEGGGGGVWEWRDAEGERLAVEEQGGEEREYRLRTMRAMERDTMDVLVAMWCCRIWEASAAAQPPIYEGMEKVRRRLRLSKEFPRAGSTIGLSVGAGAVF